MIEIIYIEVFQDTTLNLQFGSCDTPGTGIAQLDNKLSVFPTHLTEL